jgi:electron transfer flavoprotein alpha/beta subunit
MTPATASCPTATMATSGASGTAASDGYAVQALHGRALRVDRVHRALEAEALQVVQRPAADLVAVFGGAHHGDASRRKCTAAGVDRARKP